MAPKKRRPGGGRKPTGKIAGNGKALNLRVRPEVRDEIEHEAKKNGLSLNQEVQERLILSLEYDRKMPRFRHLMFLVGKVAKVIEGKSGGSWIDDPYTAMMLRGAVDFLIADLGAKGEVVVPPAISEEAERQQAEGLSPSVDPHEVGAGEAQFILGQIRARQHSTKVFNALFDKDRPLKAGRHHGHHGYSKFDALIDDLEL